MSELARRGGLQILCIRRTKRKTGKRSSRKRTHPPANLAKFLLRATPVVAWSCVVIEVSEFTVRRCAAFEGIVNDRADDSVSARTARDNFMI